MDYTLQLLSPLPTWSESAQAGVLRGETGLREVMVFLKRTHEQTGVPCEWAAPSRPGGIGLIGVLDFHKTQAWIYPLVPAVGLAHLIRGAPVLEPATAAELVAAAAERALALLETLRGLELSEEHLGVDATGQVHVLLTDAASSAGGAGPSTRLALDHLMVQRLGTLWAELLEGPLPRSAGRVGRRTQSERLVRRAIANEGLPARYLDWLGGMLQAEEDLRPPLSTVASGLRRLARHTRGPSLSEWAQTAVPRLLVQGQAEAPVTLDGQPWLPWSASDGRESELPEDPPQPLRQDSTNPGVDLRAISFTSEEDDATFIPPGKHLGPAMDPVTEPGVMPVKIGPPAALAAKPQPTLPPGFLDETTVPFEAPAGRDWRTLPLLRHLFGSAPEETR